jgi:hypothetical protein
MTRMTHWAIRGHFGRSVLTMHRDWPLCRPIPRNLINSDQAVTAFMFPAAAEENIFINRERRSFAKELPIE